MKSCLKRVLETTVAAVLATLCAASAAGQVATNRFFIARPPTTGALAQVAEVDELGSLVAIHDLASQLPAGIGTGNSAVRAHEVTPWGTLLCSTGYHPQGGWFEVDASSSVTAYYPNAGGPGYNGAQGATATPSGIVYGANYNGGNSASIRAFAAGGASLWTAGGVESLAPALLDGELYVGAFQWNPVFKYDLGGAATGAFGSFRHVFGLKAVPGSRLLIGHLPADGGPITWFIRHVPTGNQMTLNTAGYSGGAGLADVDDAGFIWIRIGSTLYKFTPDSPDAIAAVPLSLPFSPDFGLAVSGSPGFVVTAPQQNSSEASLLVNGVGASGNGPFTTSVTSGGPFQLTWNGPPYGAIVLFTGNLNPNWTYFGCIGAAHIGTPPSFSDLSVVLDSTSSPLMGALFGLDANGMSNFGGTWNGPAGLSIALQGLVLQPAGGPCPFVLTAAHVITSI